MTIQEASSGKGPAANGSLNIGFLVSTFPSLSQTFILSQITGLLDRGHEVTIHSQEWDRHALMHADVGKYALLDRTRYHARFVDVMPKHFLARCRKLPRHLLAGLRESPQPLLNSLNPLRMGRQALSLRAFYRTVGFRESGIQEHQIVHCHFGPNGNLGAFLKQVGLLRGRLVTTFYGYDISSHIKAYGPGVYRQLFRRADRVLGLSQLMRDQLAELGCPEEKLDVHHLGIDTKRFRFEPRTLQTGEPVRLLTISRLVEKKGVEYGVRAVGELLKRGHRIEYRVAGDGPLRGPVEDLIRSLGVGDRIHLLGWQDQARIVELLGQAHILLAPSVTASDGDQEGTPTALIEALARGLPVVSTRHSGIPEIVRDEESGFLVDERDVGGLTEKLELLIRHPERWGGMGLAGRHRVEQEFDTTRLNDRLVELYRGLVR